MAKLIQQNQGMRLHQVLNAVVMLVLAFVVVRVFNERPSYTDAYYHYNAAVRLASGDGLVDDYLWTYIAAPDALPAPSHLYWMPLTSIVSAVSMSLFGVNYFGAQVGLALAIWAASLVAFWLGVRFTGRIFLGWLASFLLLGGGFLLRMWGITDTFAIYAFVGSISLLLMGLGLADSHRRWLWWILAGVFAALGHLTRSDGLLLLLVGMISLLWPLRSATMTWRSRSQFLGLFVVSYLIVMLPWFLRNLNIIGSILPVGGTQAIWYTQYEDLFNYPPDANPQTFFESGLDQILQSRIEGMMSAIQNLIAIEGYIILTPFMLYALWVRRRDPFMRPMIWFAIGLHVAFSIVFTYPGIRGGMLHGLTALMPFWAALSFVGLQSAVSWMAARLSHWDQYKAETGFSLMMAVVAIVFGLALGLPRRVLANDPMPELYQTLKQIVPEGERVMLNNPSELYYYTGLGGVSLPNEGPDIVQDIAAKYDIDYLVVQYKQNDADTSDSLTILLPEPLIFDLDNPPAFLTPLNIEIDGARVYAITH